MIPSLLSENVLGFLGPLVSEDHLEKCVKFFPCYHTTKRIANKIVSSRNNEDSVQREAFQLDFITDSFRPFRSCPTLDKSYLAWLTKVEKKKASFSKELGIFDLIQMSKLGFSYCQPLLLSSLYFWDSTYNTFHLPCGMMTPTLFDVAAISGLSPTGETFDPYQDCENLIDFNVKNASFSTYINLYHADGKEVSDIEHISFLGLWLSKFFFCCKSLQVAKRFLTLTNQLHVGRRVCLSELLLASLYESLGSASAKLKEYEAGTNLLLSGPYWLLQLWLNATFESFLPTQGNVDESAPEIINRSIKGTRLLQLTPVDDVDILQTSLAKYTLMFSKRHHFFPLMAPFSSRTHGSSWFTALLEDAVKNTNTKIEDIWRAFLFPRLLVSRILPVKSHVCLLAYQPNFVSRQFGLCQLIPVSLFNRKREI
ncbi:uncharacterized protein LOC127135752 [Lathyrus oleraceus]|uniref:uncharacterized protein LOC127135752 n=1 Tax=Pisum sativum TaxID=3888 RepID=UPI0021D09525|nr:uncharacterized protein LOC127135752 [Pisum sativum]